MNDYEIINSSADKLSQIIGGHGMGMISVFLLKLYVSRFDDCISIIEDLGSDFKDESIQLLKSIVYKELCENLDVDLHISDGAEISIDDAIGLLKDYDENGVDKGIINGAKFKIM